MYTMEYYSAIRKDEILPFATTGMDLQNTVVSEISHTEKVKKHDFIHMRDIKLKTANEQTRQTNKQKLINTDTSMGVTERTKGGGSKEGERGQI